ncbi:hypothetical protein HBI56_060940 [Parastagonospora nodorum]|nr:hypothetical protein HBH53_124250 [Parastagonospora nodorum]KAH3969589.1 hypothetical protein HBH52_172250 [Parastagonospora nodorum]KAH3973643.1 hypothetical protein HBH51_097460 [Parastagonospora nodorum]KAH4002281.1 hypothetical protein HBI10_073800 [Parastagonospora nodorum]KAH4017959.1 hypothetical protein HBI13_137330 [Parastagonospora nodorum]
MYNTAINVPPGYYTTAAIINLATAHFPGVYNALLDPSSLVWDTTNIPGFYYDALFVGYIKIDCALHKVLACMAAVDGAVSFFTNSGSKLSPGDRGSMQLVAPWAYLAEPGIARPQLVNLVTMLQFFFAASGVSGGVMAKKGWFRTMEVGCELVGEGMGILGGGEIVLREIGDGGYEGGDEGAAPGMQVGKSARIVQRLVGMAKRVNGDWAAHVERELKGAWPGMKKHWRK